MDLVSDSERLYRQVLEKIRFEQLPFRFKVQQSNPRPCHLPISTQPQTSILNLVRSRQPIAQSLNLCSQAQLFLTSRLVIVVRCCAGHATR